MLIKMMFILAAVLATGIETAYVPTEEGGGEYLVRVEPDLVRNANPYTLTSDVPADSRNVRRVKVYVADAWPSAVERSIAEAAKRPRAAPVAALAPSSTRLADAEVKTVGAEKPWGWLIASLIALFLSLGLNVFLGMLLAQMRQRYVRDLGAAPLSS
ncbi:MAG: hypothetical protein EBR28_08270 [Planctomycetia bacterium]|nr:hypothetical protein [Planctomycetia bacterium]